jgi:biopolymer transport protein TolQ
MRMIGKFAGLLPALVLVASLGLAFSPTAHAQSTPEAAPTSAPAETAPLAAPTADVSADGLESRSVSALGGVSVTELFMRADPLVKTVMVLLLAASLWSWMIIFNKWLGLSKLRGQATKFEKLFWSGKSLDELFAQYASHNDHPFTAVFVAGLREWRRAFENGAPREALLAGVKDRVAKAMNVTIAREVDVIENQLGFLASVASTAPFVGLFGTVWGIMNSFAAIAARHDTTLAVVAPGIAEALFATAMGLLAAIPAAFFYNSFVGQIGRYTNRLDTFADELSGILSRQLDEKAH